MGRQLEGVLGSGQTIGGRSGERADNLRAFRRGCGRLESVPPQNLEEGGGGAVLKARSVAAARARGSTTRGTARWSRRQRSVTSQAFAPVFAPDFFPPLASFSLFGLVLEVVAEMPFPTIPHFSPFVPDRLVPFFFFFFFFCLPPRFSLSLTPHSPTATEFCFCTGEERKGKARKRKASIESDLH